MSELNLIYNTTLQSNNTDLQAILNTINELPEVNEWSENEDAIIAGEIKSYINDRVTNIKNGAFQYCHSLTTVSFPKCERIGHNAFYFCQELTDVNFPVCIVISSAAFQYCYSLTTANFPECVNINDYAFQYCHSLTTVSFPECVNINYYAFGGCTSLTTVSFPVCTVIFSAAFDGCTSLTTVSFPKCERIYHNAFFGCRRLKSLYLMNSKMCTLSNSTAFDITPIGGYSDWISTYGSIYVPTSLLTSYQTATNWAYFSSRFVGI